jgi:cytochrome b
VLVVPFQWWTAHNDEMELHILSGQVALGLILFRILWGLVGSETARFARFLKGPRAVAAHLAGRGERYFGHNPIGGWSVAAMLLLLVVQVGLGLFATDEDGIYSGPLSHLVSFDTATMLAETHELVFKILLGFIALHLAAIAWYWLVRRDDLVTPMVTGTRAAAAGEAGIAPVSLGRVAAVAAVAAGLTLAISKAF